METQSYIEPHELRSLNIGDIATLIVEKTFRALDFGVALGIVSEARNSEAEVSFVEDLNVGISDAIKALEAGE